MRSFMHHGQYHYKPTSGFRSGLEERVSEQIKLYGGLSYEEYYLPYIIPASHHRYTPDFVLPNGIIIETKGLFEAADRRKHMLIKEAYPNLDIRFVFQNAANRIYKGSSTTYGDWCKHNNFKFAIKLIPPQWFCEEQKDTSGLIRKEVKH